MVTEPHKHCPTCGTPIPMDERFCSPKCEQVVAERQRQVAKARTMIYVLLAILLIIAGIFFVFRSRIFG